MSFIDFFQTSVTILFSSIISESKNDRTFYCYFAKIYFLGTKQSPRSSKIMNKIFCTNILTVTLCLLFIYSHCVQNILQVLEFYYMRMKLVIIAKQSEIMITATNNIRYVSCLKMTDFQFFNVNSLCSRNCQNVRNAFIFPQISLNKPFFNITYFRLCCKNLF